jgi:NADPH:quinone reductase-like Zn-dependent oxidoreductase
MHTKLIRITNHPSPEVAMKAAVVTSFDAPPRYEDFPSPAPARADEIIVDVLAAGLHPRVRSQASGSHYTSTDQLPLVPGIDGVGRGPDGRLRYFVLPDTTMGAMAQQTVVDVRRSVVLSPEADPVVLAAAMNPAMSSWVGLRQRVAFQPGQRVLILGATGSAGQLAVQIAKLFGAGQIVAAGRDSGKLAALTAAGVTDTVVLDGSRDAAGQLGQAARDVDVVIDYLWGQPTADALRAIIPARTDDGQQLTWLQIGSVAGTVSPIPSAALRAARLQIVGSGQGSVSARAILTELPALAREITRGTFQVNARAVPLADVGQAWADAATGAQRIVLVPEH